jgi:hypothetical protein
MRSHRTWVVVVTVLAAAVLTIVMGTLAAGFFGAIYTTTVDGTVVNQNLYDAKSDVYINGGPQNTNAQGLPAGTYYFQVTDPSGAHLLSTDAAVCRQVLVAGDRLAGPTGPCPHAPASTNDANGSLGVQLIPFNDTPNAGGEYKVWLIRQATTTSVATDGIHINFLNSNAKTDNFKIRNVVVVCTPGQPDCPNVSLSGHKFYDANGNGIQDNGEVGVAGIRIQITLTLQGDQTPQAPVIVTTDSNGDWILDPVPAGASYVVQEIVPTACQQNATWVETAPQPDNQNFQGYSGTANIAVSGLDFGDLCESPGTGGLTLGFWSNKNGQSVMTTGGPNGVDTSAYVATSQTGLSGDLLFLSNLNLKGEAASKRSVITTEFNPASYSDLRTWILSADAYNMSYMLSAQLAATSLDVRHRYLSDSQVVDARNVCNTAGSCLGFITIGEVRVLANQSLDVLNGGNTTISGDPHRDSQELMKNFLDAVNNNQVPFVHSSPCDVCYIDITLLQ